MDFDLNTREGQIKGLMSYGYPRAKAEKIVDVGKFDETIQYDYRALVTDPLGVWEEKRKKQYYYAETIE